LNANKSDSIIDKSNNILKHEVECVTYQLNNNTLNVTNNEIKDENTSSELNKDQVVQYEHDKHSISIPERDNI